MFESLTDNQIETLLERATIRRYAAGSVIFQRGERTGEVGFLISGRIKLFNLSQNGRESILGFIYPGQVFGDDGFPDETVHEDSAEAVEAVRVAYLPRSSFQRLINQYPAIATAYAQFESERYLRTQRRLRTYLFQQARDRVWHILQALADECGDPCEDGIRLRYLVSHQEIANHIGSTRETASLAISELRDSGLVRMDGRRFVLTPPGASSSI